MENETVGQAFAKLPTAVQGLVILSGIVIAAVLVAMLLGIAAGIKLLFTFVF